MQVVMALDVRSVAHLNSWPFGPAFVAKAVSAGKIKTFINSANVNTRLITLTILLLITDTRLSLILFYFYIYININ